MGSNGLRFSVATTVQRQDGRYPHLRRVALAIGLFLVTGTAARPQYIFWADSSTGKLMRANLNGSNITGIVSGLLDPRGVAVDPVAQKVYWADYDSHVGRAGVDGSNPEILLLGPNLLAEDLYIDPYARDVYWVRLRHPVHASPGYRRDAEQGLFGRSQR